MDISYCDDKTGFPRPGHIFIHVSYKRFFLFTLGLGDTSNKVLRLLQTRCCDYCQYCIRMLYLLKVTGKWCSYTIAIYVANMHLLLRVKYGSISSVQYCLCLQSCNTILQYIMIFCNNITHAVLLYMTKCWRYWYCTLHASIAVWRYY